MTPTSAFTSGVAELKSLLNQLDALAPKVEAFGQLMKDSWQQGGKVMFAGNGGSAADAMHFAEELSIRFHRNRRALAAISLLDSSVITCCANDFGYEYVFSRQIEALGKPGDVFVGLSTSGNSSNVIRAVEVSKKIGVKTVGFLGKDGGKLKGQCDVELIVPSESTARIQEIHKLVFHSLCVWIDEIADEV